jgi:hypothetical protein
MSLEDLRQRYLWIAKNSLAFLKEKGFQKFLMEISRNWRREWDSNPRYVCTHNGFRDGPNVSLITNANRL